MRMVSSWFMPAKGSSSRRTVGLVARPMAMPSARRWPCGRLRGELVPRRGRGRGSRGSRRRRRRRPPRRSRAVLVPRKKPSRLALRAQVVGDDDVVAHAHAAEDRRLLEGAHHALAGHEVRGEVGDALALEAAPRPRSVGRKEAISLNSVDLPAPFGPMTERISRSRDVEGDVVDGGEPAEALGDVLRPRGARSSRRLPAARPRLRRPFGRTSISSDEQRRVDQELELAGLEQEVPAEIEDAACRASGRRRSRGRRGSSSA